MNIYIRLDESSPDQFDIGNIICQKDLVQDGTHINEMEGLSFAKTDLAKYRDVCSDKFLLYLLDGVTIQQHRS